MARIDVKVAGGVNRLAFLDMIAFGEIGPALLKMSDDGYDVLVGSTPAAPLLFEGYATHPNVFNQKLNSTAAGRYQILARYAKHYGLMLGLKNFGPVAQDTIALQLVRERGALGYLDAGNVERAIKFCNTCWASLPGSPYGQRTDRSPSLDNFVEAYRNAGGRVA